MTARRPPWLKRAGIAALGVVLAAALAAAYWLTQPPSRQAPSGGVAVEAALGSAGAQQGYAQVLQPRKFVFPADYGPHPRYRNEWWYFTGNVATADGRRFGYELTLFRIALAPKPPQSRSQWATNQLYMAHFALTDVAGKQFYDAQRLARGALGLAGADAKPFRVWVHNWRVRSSGHGAAFPWQLQAKAKGWAVNFDLRALTPVVAQGDRGFSRKSAGRGHASYYYSIPRLATHGSITLHGKTFRVTGLSWLDREWSSGALGADQTGWDWFALQFNDGESLMFYRLRDRGGRTDSHSAGSVIAPDGSRQPLGASDVKLRPLRWWRSSDGARYPIAWRLRIPAHGCALRVEPLLDDQEFKTFVRYWEGAVSVSGRCLGKRVSGHGYLELTGYAPGKGGGPR